MIIKAGADAGNNALKLWVRDQHPMMIPSIYSEYFGDAVEALDMTDIPAANLEIGRAHV